MPLSAQKQRERRAAPRAAEAQRVRSVSRTLVARIGCAAPLSTASRAGAAHMRHGEGGRDPLPVLRPSASAHGPRGTCAPREAPPPRPVLPTRLRWHPPTRRRSRRVRLLGDVERGARRLRSLLPSTTTTAATVGAFARALRGRVLTSCRGCRRCSSDEGRGKGCSGDGPGGEARPATGPLPPPTAPGPCTRRRLAAAFPCLRATRWGSRPKRARVCEISGL